MRRLFLALALGAVFALPTVTHAAQRVGFITRVAPESVRPGQRVTISTQLVVSPDYLQLQCTGWVFLPQGVDQLATKKASEAAPAVWQYRVPRGVKTEPVLAQVDVLVQCVHGRLGDVDWERFKVEADESRIYQTVSVVPTALVKGGAFTTSATVRSAGYPRSPIAGTKCTMYLFWGDGFKRYAEKRAIGGVATWRARVPDEATPAALSEYVVVHCRRFRDGYTEVKAVNIG